MSGEMRIAGLLALVILVVTSCAMCVADNDDENILVIFHAGSLAGPFGELEEIFEEENDGVDVRREPAGSAATIRKVTELGKDADVVASADFTLIDTMMVDADPAFADYSIQFARNSMTLAYTDMSAHHDEIDQDNWYEVLQRDGVKFGFSNPNDDPCGYRSLMVVQLAEFHYGDDTIFDRLIEDNTAIKGTTGADGNFTVTMPKSSALDPDNDDVMIRSSEVELMAPLEAGELDYLFIYRSVAYQHRGSGVDYLELPEEVDLSSTGHADGYGKVQVTLASKDTVKAKPIVYGVTIPEEAEHGGLAVRFIAMLLGETGQEVLSGLGQQPIVPAVCSMPDSLPDELKEYVDDT